MTDERDAARRNRVDEPVKRFAKALAERRAAVIVNIGESRDTLILAPPDVARDFGDLCRLLGATEPLLWNMLWGGGGVATGGDPTKT